MNNQPPPGNPYNIVASSGFQPNPQHYPPPQHQYPPHPQMMPGMPYPPMEGQQMYPPQMNPHANHYAYQQYSAPPQPAQPPAPAGNSDRNYSFLEPIIPTEKRESLAINMIRQDTSKITEVYKKVYIGKIPMEIKDSLIERLLKACGGVEWWKRAIDSNGNPKSFGY